MKSNTNFFFLIMSLFLGLSLTSLAQNVDYSKYPDYSPILKPDWSLMQRAKTFVKGLDKVEAVRPSHVNNAETPYWPGIISQAGGSCGSASRICYMFNYEVNCERGVDGSLAENQYPSHFTWLLTYHGSGKEQMAAANGVPNSVVYGGRTYSRLFGAQTWENDDFGWMQGYEKWYNAMCNRIYGNGNFPANCNTDEGREAVKNWIWNHNGDTDFHAGGIVGIGVASACGTAQIPETAANNEAGAVGMHYVTNWGDQVDHALTIVGYDDRLEFDLDGDGNVGEVNEDEVGAWIVANSWGNWKNSGFVYCPYKYSSPIRKGEGSYWNPEIYKARKNYRPLRAIKVKMRYSRRSELQLGAGIAKDVNAEEPEGSIFFHHFNYAGNHNGEDPAPECPMLGRWADGVHYEPMEFGYDLTDFSENYDTRGPLKYFFVIHSKTNAIGEGKIYDVSIIDYEFDENGIETKASIDSVAIKNGGQTTYVSVVVKGEPLNSPLNLKGTNGVLSWEAPRATLYDLVKYNVYCNGELVGNTNADVLEYNTNGQDGDYSVSAVYSYQNNEYNSVKSNSIRVSNAEKLTQSLRKTQKLNNSGFIIKDIFNEKYSQMTIEYWLKPISVSNWNQQIGPGWGQFLIHTTTGGQFVVGWDNSNRISTAGGTFTTGKWTHVAAVFDGNILTTYVNGNQTDQIVSNNSGIGGFGDLRVGVAGSDMNAYMEEFRIWSSARSQEQIQGMMNCPVINPTEQSDLLCYYPMDEVEVNGETLLADFARGNHAAFTNDSHNASSDFTKMIDPENAVLKANFDIQNGPYYVGNPVKVVNTSLETFDHLEWTIEGTDAAPITIADPTLFFDEAGDKVIKLTIYDESGESNSVTKAIHIEALPTPVADFSFSKDVVKAGEHFSLINLTETEGCTYEWLMPGAVTERALTTNASVCYQQAGTYTITLKVTNSTGSTSVDKTIVVHPAAASAKMKITPNEITLGETVYLEDQSLYNPTKWSWILKSNNNAIAVDGQNSSIKPTMSGVYDVTLKAGNNIGSSSITEKRAIVVQNADGGNSLVFDGKDDKVTAQAPFGASGYLTKFTIEWWMNPTGNLAKCCGLGLDGNSLLLETNKNGSMTLSIYQEGKSASTDANYVIMNEWHHYAVSFTMGTASCYRDGELINTIKPGIAFARKPAQFCISTLGAPMSGQIDELRLWNKVVSVEDLRANCNAPLADIETAKANGLLMYYQFNQNSGDVEDVTGNGFTGIRSGFGPDGDAWSEPRGIFTLNFDQAAAEDITSTYLTNYQRAFIAQPGEYAQSGTRYKKIKTATDDSAWILENSITEGDITTGFHIDANKGNAMTCTTSWDGFAGTLSNHKAYQVITLPAGAYEFSLEEYVEFAAGSSYLAVASGEGLPNSNDLENDAIASASMSDKTLNFVLPEETKVSIGMVVNMSGKSCLTIDHFNLKRKNCEFVKADGVTGITLPKKKNELTTIYAEAVDGGIKVSTNTTSKVRIYTIAGSKLYDTLLSGEKVFVLPIGIYLVNNQKVVVD